MVVPITNQYEQLCNAEVLKTMGVPVIKKLSEKYNAIIGEWIENGNAIHVDYPDITETVVDTILNSEYATIPVRGNYQWKEPAYKISHA